MMHVSTSPHYGVIASCDVAAMAAARAARGSQIHHADQPRLGLSASKARITSHGSNCGSRPAVVQLQVTGGPSVAPRPPSPFEAAIWSLPAVE